jgi:UDP-N-acetylglucosamine 2-epimerase (non-hydrolysing)/UDP-N-acetylglucosamine 2-epimerase (hydrolysing)
VLRESTERQELVDAGGACLVGTQAHQIVEQASEWLREPQRLQAMRVAHSPFGDGHAAQRIAEVLCRELPAPRALTTQEVTA